MQLIGVAAVLFSYLGARSLTEGKRGKKPWALAIGGISISIIMGLMFFLLSQTLEEIQTMERPVSHNGLPTTWGEDMQPAEREHSSLIYARMAYVDAQKIINYVDQSGAWKPYCPTADDAKQIAELAEAKAQVQALVASARNSALAWWISGGVALLAGIYIGWRAKNAG